MATQKITLNELRSVIRQIIKEEMTDDFKSASTSPKSVSTSPKTFFNALITIKEKNGTIVWEENFIYHDDESLARYIMDKKKLWKHHDVEYKKLGINPYIKAGTK